MWEGGALYGRGARGEVCSDSMNSPPLSMLPSPPHSPPTPCSYEGLFGVIGTLIIMAPITYRLSGVEGEGIHEDIVDTWAVRGGEGTRGGETGEGGGPPSPPVGLRKFSARGRGGEEGAGGGGEV